MVGETPAGGEFVDGNRALGGVGQVPAGALQALAADQRPDGDVLVLEEAVQVADGDVVRGCDGVRGQVRIVQVPADEGADAQGQGPPVRLGGEVPTTRSSRPTQTVQGCEEFWLCRS